MAVALSGVTTDTVSSPVDVTGNFAVQVHGLVGGAIVVLTGSLDGGTTYDPIREPAITKNGLYVVPIQVAAKVKVETQHMTGSGATVSVWIV